MGNKTKVFMLNKRKRKNLESMAKARAKRLLNRYCKKKISDELTSEMVEKENQNEEKAQSTSSGAEASSSSVRQRVLPTGDNNDFVCDDEEATTSQQYDTDPLNTVLDIKAEVYDPDDDQPMDQDNMPKENYIFVEPEIKKEEDFEDTFELENSVTVLSHVAKSTAQTEELRTQLETKTSLIEMYKNQVNELQHKNVVLQDHCEKLTKLLKKCPTKSSCKEIGTEFKKVLSYPQDNLENYRKKVLQKERRFKTKINMLLKSIEECQEVLKIKQKQWETKENEYLEKIKQLEQNLRELKQGQVDNQAVRYLELDNALEEKEREWLEKERQWLEHLEMKETQWLEKERLWQEQVEERDRQISQLMLNRLIPNNR